MNRDELDHRVRSLNAERARPVPDPPVIQRMRQAQVTPENAVLLRRLVSALVGLYVTPPDAKRNPT